MGVFHKDKYNIDTHKEGKVTRLSADQVEALCYLFKKCEKQERMSAKSLCVSTIK